MGRSRLLLGAAVLLAACAAACASTQFYADNSLFFETFDKGWESRWIHSRNSKFTGRFTVTTPSGWMETGLQAPDQSRFYGISALTKQPVDLSENLVIQYEVKFTEGINCGGAYLKLVSYSSSFTPEALTNETPYSIMFGPDVCGASNKVHVILRHRNPKSGTVTEKHLKTPPTAPADEQTHLYTLVLNSAANKYEVLIDGETQAAGSLLKDFSPAFAPKKEILDPSDKKPVDWVDEAKIADPTASKPENWDDRVQVPDESAKKPSGWLDDEPEMIPDKSAKEPEDWDEEEDGKWEPPTIPNPKCKVGCGKWTRPLKHNPAYKGPWTAPMIDNPQYKGPWKQRKLPNPDYYEEKRPLQNVADIGAVAIEVWMVDSGFTFDNILLTSDPTIAREYRDRAWRAKKKAEDAAEGRTSRDLTSLAEAAEAILDQPSLSALKPVLGPVLTVMKKYPPVAYLVILLTFTSIFYILAVCLASLKNNHPEAKRRRAADAKKAARRADRAQRAAARKKDDDVDADEDADEDEDEDETDSEEEEEEVLAKAAAERAAAREQEKTSQAAKKAAAEALKRAERDLKTYRWAQQAAAATAEPSSSDRLMPVKITEIEEDSDSEEEAAAARTRRKPKA